MQQLSPTDYKVPIEGSLKHIASLVFASKLEASRNKDKSQACSALSKKCKCPWVSGFMLSNNVYCGELKVQRAVGSRKGLVRQLSNLHKIKVKQTVWCSFEIVGIFLIADALEAENCYTFVSIKSGPNYKTCLMSTKQVFLQLADWVIFEANFSFRFSSFALTNPTAEYLFRSLDCGRNISKYMWGETSGKVYALTFGFCLIFR